MCVVSNLHFKHGFIQISREVGKSYPRGLELEQYTYRKKAYTSKRFHGLTASCTITSWQRFISWNICSQHLIILWSFLTLGIVFIILCYLGITLPWYKICLTQVWHYRLHFSIEYFRIVFPRHIPFISKWFIALLWRHEWS